MRKVYFKRRGIISRRRHIYETENVNLLDEITLVDGCIYKAAALRIFCPNYTSRHRQLEKIDGGCEAEWRWPLSNTITPQPHQIRYLDLRIALREMGAIEHATTCR